MVFSVARGDVGVAAGEEVLDRGAGAGVEGLEWRLQAPRAGSDAAVSLRALLVHGTCCAFLIELIVLGFRVSCACY